MDAVQIAKQVVAETKEVARFVSPEVRELVAIGKIAIIIDGMDESIHASIKVYRLEEAMREVRSILAANQ